MKVRLIHWKVDEAQDRAAALRRAGFEVDASPFAPPEVRKIVANLPKALIIDLSRLPSQGRDAGLFLRQVKATREIPLVFVDGNDDKVAGIRRLLPDATYTTWPKIAGALKSAMRRHPISPVVPGVFAGYAGAPLAKKLGVKSNSIVALVDAPSEFERRTGVLPAGVTLRRNPRGSRDLTLWFVRSRRDLEDGIASMREYADSAGLWILWQKHKSNRAVDVSQVVVRKAGLAAGIVDFKISSIDDTWSGLRFTRRENRDKKGAK